jgi:U3 small nucleolar RNA-associated protein 21
MKKAIGLGVSVDNLKSQPIIGISSSSTRSKDWDDVLTAHAEDSSARTWRVQDKRLGDWMFDMEEGGAVQAVCVTQCGNFGLAGSSTGEIRMWNMQSGKERKSFALTGPAPGNTKPKIITNSKPKKAKAKQLKKSIEAITGLATDNLNTMVVAGTLEGKLYVSCGHATGSTRPTDISSSLTSIPPSWCTPWSLTALSLLSTCSVTAACCLSSVTTLLCASWTLRPAVWSVSCAVSRAVSSTLSSLPTRAGSLPRRWTRL